MNEDDTRDAILAALDTGGAMEGDVVSFPHLFARVLNAPLMIEPGKAQIILGILADRAGVGGYFVVPGHGANARVRLADLGMAARAGESGGSGFQAEQLMHVRDGVAVIPVRGTLVNKGALHPESGRTSYQGVRLKLETARGDPSVRGVLFDIDSHGGEVPGLFPLVDEIFATRAEKPVWAVATDIALSAGYAIASAADRIIIPELTGHVGSVGVLTLHTDISGKLQKEGVKITMLTAGARKAAGNPLEPLDDQTRDEILARMAATYDRFVASVAKGRPALSANAVRETQAAIFRGPDALAAGLVDGLMDPAAVLPAMVEAVSGRGPGLVLMPAAAADGAGMPHMEDGGMDEETETGQGDGGGDGGSAGVGTGAALTAEQLTQAAADARLEAEARMRTIMELGGAAMFPTLAKAIAFDTAIGADGAEALLVAAAVDGETAAKAAGRPSPLDAAMEGLDPNVGVGEASEGGDETAQAIASINASADKARGVRAA